MTGAGKDGKDNGENTDVSSFARVSYVPVDDNNMRFVLEATVSIAIKFPAFLLKILPTNKEKAEESGAKSISKSIEKDITKSLAAFEQAYESHIAGQ